MKKKICIILTTRGNYGKTKNILKLLNQDDNIELQVVLGGMVVSEKYGRMEHLLEKMNIKLIKKVNFVVEGESLTSMVKTSGLAVLEFGTVFQELNPDLVLIVADRFECLPMAMAAAYLNIRIAHLEGGEVSGSIDESVRHAITKMAHLHFPATKEAGERIIKMGEDPSKVHIVGGTSLDVLNEVSLSDLTDFNEYQKSFGMGPILEAKKKEYVIVIQHPVTTEYEDNLKHMKATLSAISNLDMNTFWILPNMDAGSHALNKAIRQYRESNSKKLNIHYFKSLPIEIYGPLLANSACLIGNSSSGIRESAFLGIPSVNIGTRQQGRVRANNVLDVNYDEKEILVAIKKQISNKNIKRDFTFGDGNACEKIYNILINFESDIQKQITY